MCASVCRQWRKGWGRAGRAQIVAVNVVQVDPSHAWTIADNKVPTCQDAGLGSAHLQTFEHTESWVAAPMFQCLAGKCFILGRACLPHFRCQAQALLHLLVYKT